MIKTLFRSLLLMTLIVSSIAPAAVAADVPKERGLLITPLRTYHTVVSGEAKTRSVTIANMTNAPINVSLSVAEFSVADYTYDYTFTETSDKWITFVQNNITLKPFESREAAYTITIPPDAPPGGRYFTLFAGADLSKNGTAGKVRVASLLYITVDGQLVETSELIDISMPWLITTPKIPYEITVENTGNTHYFAAFGGNVEGLGYTSKAIDDSHLLMPDTTRRIMGSFASPILPGIYKVTVGYVPEGASLVAQTRYIAFFPLWSIIALLMLGFVSYKLWRHRKKKIKIKSPTDS